MMNYRSLLSSAIISILMVTTQIEATTAFAAAPKPTATVEMSKILQLGKGKDKIEGEENAPVTIVEYASVTCIHCANFYNDVLPEIREKYIKTGKVKLIFREFAFDPRATAGFMLARCIPEDRYFPLIETLFHKQNEWAFGQDALTPLKKISFMAGFTEESFNACLTNQSILNEVNASFEQGKELGVRGTPTFFINGNRYDGEMSAKDFFTVIDNLL
ncbi:DsbA family protein [Bartonella sp. B30(2025)]